MGGGHSEPIRRVRVDVSLKGGGLECVFFLPEMIYLFLTKKTFFKEECIWKTRSENGKVNNLYSPLTGYGLDW